MSNSTETTPQQPAPGEALDHLAHLRKMSATAGVALGEYRAVNVLAVTALVLGVASWMSLLHPLLYLLPVCAIAIGAIALLQIRRSNGTQSGAVLAGLGALLALALGGWALASNLSGHYQVERHRGEISQMIDEFGAELAQSDFDAAYHFTSVNFRREITPEQFRNDMSLESQRLGGIRRASTNELARITKDASGNTSAQAMMMIEIGYPEPLRQQVTLVKEEDGWRIQEFEAWFPRAGRPRPTR